jgi:hypothetical protein
MIEPTEGFYFRHDSKKNPSYEANLAKNIFNDNTKSKQICMQSMTNSNLKSTFIDKIKSQWRYIKNAFADLSFGKGFIYPE